MKRSRRGFTLVEMLVVIGIISILIAIILPSLAKARAQAEKVKCMSNLMQLGHEMLIYAESNNGYLFPPNKGWTPGKYVPDTNPPQMDVWPYYITNPHVWNPPMMLCPSDIDPAGDHSYIANADLLPLSMPEVTTQPTGGMNDIKYSSRLPAGHTPSDVIVVGEKISGVFDYNMEGLYDFTTKVELYRHGLHVGSNYLMLDMHVETMIPGNPASNLDPWNPTNPSGG